MRRSGEAGGRSKAGSWTAKAAALPLALLIALSCVTVVPTAASPTPVPTFDFLNVPGNNATIEEAYSWIKEGGTIMVGSGTHLVSLSIDRNVHIVSAGGADSTILRPRHGGMFSAWAPCTISGFTVYGNGTFFVAASETTRDVVVTDNVISNASVLGNCEGFVFRGNVMDGHDRFLYLSMRQEAGVVEQNTFLGEMELQLQGSNWTISDNEVERCGLRITGDHNTVDGNDFQGGGRFDWSIISSGSHNRISNCTFRNCEIGVSSGGSYETISDNVLTNCSYGLDLDSPGGHSKIVRNDLSDCSLPIFDNSRDHDLIMNNSVWTGQTIDQSGGISVGYCSGMTVVGNTVRHALYGIAVQGDNCTLSDNTVSDLGQIYVSTATGLGAYFDDGEVRGNRVLDIYGQGLVIGGSRNQVEGNLVQGCQQGVTVYTSARHNSITNNDIIDNNITCFDEQLSNVWDRNLFSDYAGPDGDGDGIGDIPYIMDGGNQDPHPRIFGEAPELGDYNVGILPITFVESPQHAGQTLTYPIAYYEDLGRELSAYYREASYGALDLKVQVLRGPNDALISLPDESAALEAKGVEELLGHILRQVDDKVDFRGYDYGEEGGRGILVIVLPMYIVRHSNPLIIDECDFYYGAEARFGGFVGLDGTSVDVICCFARGFLGQEKSTRSLQHEVAHWLGKALVTNPAGFKVYGRWSLPDEYTMGNVRQPQSLMGKMVLRSQDRVHLDSWSKLWLGWLQTEWMQTERTYALKALPQMQLHDPVPSFDFTRAGPGGRHMSGSYIFEARSRDSSISDWDRDTNPFEAVNVYQLDTTSLTNVRIDLLAQLQSDGGSVVIPDLGIALQAVSVFGANGTKVRVINYTLTDMTGATLLPNGEALKRIQESLPFVDLAPGAWPDADLHAYAQDGRHVGMNYTSGSFEVQIPGALYSGDLQGGREWIYVPSSIQPRFVISCADTAAFLDEFPSTFQYTDGTETALLQVGRWGDDGALYLSDIELRELDQGEEYEVPYQMVQDQDGSYSVDVTDLGMFKVTISCTGLPPSTEWTVHMDGIAYSTFIAFQEMQLSEGQHTYTVEGPSGYIASPSSGVLTVSGPGANLTISFAKEGGVIPGLELDMTTMVMIGGGVVALLLVLILAVAMRSRGRRRN